MSDAAGIDGPAESGAARRRAIESCRPFTSDNYIALMPGERQTIRTELEHRDTRGEPPNIVVEGFNVGDVTQT